jgi:hypothetical protein
MMEPGASDNSQPCAKQSDKTMKSTFGITIPQTLDDVCNPTSRFARLRHAGRHFESDQKPGADHATSSQSAERGPRRWSSRILFATSFVTKRTDGNVSVPHGHGLATD